MIHREIKVANLRKMIEMKMVEIKMAAVEVAWVVAERWIVVMIVKRVIEMVAMEMKEFYLKVHGESKLPPGSGTSFTFSQEQTDFFKRCFDEGYNLFIDADYVY